MHDANILTKARHSESTDLPIVPIRHYGRWLAAGVIAVTLAAVAQSVITNERFSWDVVAAYLFHPSILHGLVTTIWLTIVAMLVGVILGTITAVMRSSENPLVSATATGYVWFFRGTPLLVQLIFWYNIAALYPTLNFGIPFGPTLISLDANTYIPVYVAAILGLGLNEAAYMSEIVRSGLNAVPKGQREAGEALGMRESRILVRIILPQAMKVIIPPTSNQFISMLKTTSLVSVIAMQDLLYSAQLIYSSNFQTIPLLIVAATWFLVMTSILSYGQYLLERRFNDTRTKAVKKDSANASSRA